MWLSSSAPARKLSLLWRQRRCSSPSTVRQPTNSNRIESNHFLIEQTHDVILYISMFVVQCFSEALTCRTHTRAECTSKDRSEQAASAVMGDAGSPGCGGSGRWFERGFTLVVGRDCRASLVCVDPLADLSCTCQMWEHVLAAEAYPLAGERCVRIPFLGENFIFGWWMHLCRSRLGSVDSRDVPSAVNCRCALDWPGGVAAVSLVVTPIHGPAQGVVQGYMCPPPLRAVNGVLRHHQWLQVREGGLRTDEATVEPGQARLGDAGQPLVLPGRGGVCSS